MDVLRTPDDRFDNLPGWPYAPQYLDHDGMLQHYVDGLWRPLNRGVPCVVGSKTRDCSP